jgi:hypothetical protein
MSRTVQFVRKGAAQSNSSTSSTTRGTRTWTHQLVISSSGSASIDAVLGVGGGLGVPLGSLVLVIEDFPSRAHAMVTSMFAAEAASHQHGLAIIGQQAAPAVIEQLPSIAIKSKAASSRKKEDTQGDNHMNIAWRYEKYVGDENKEAVARSSNMSGANVVAAGSSAGSLAGNYDFRGKMNEKDSEDLIKNRLYVLNGLDDLVDRNLLEMDSSQVLRILIPSLGNPLFDQGLGKTPDNLSIRVRRYLSRLRRLVDGKRAIAMVTIPRILFPDEEVVKSFECFADGCIQLSCFTQSKEEHGFGDAHGILTVRKLIHLNSLACQYPDTLNYLYTISKKNLEIEKMSLPPEESRTGDGSHSQITSKGNSSLEF